MKISKSYKISRGFTLVELLTVIVVIAILSTIGVQVGSKAINQSRKMQSKVDVTNLCGAMEGLKSDNNGVYPNITGETATVNVATDDSGLILDGNGVAGNLVAALLGDDSAAALDINGRETVYFDAKQAQADGSGGVDIAKTYSFTDYWGNAYQLIWDSNYDDQVENPLDSTEPPIRRGVIALGKGTSEEDLSDTMSSKNKLGVVTSW